MLQNFQMKEYTYINTLLFEWSCFKNCTYKVIEKKKLATHRNIQVNRPLHIPIREILVSN